MVYGLHTRAVTKFIERVRKHLERSKAKGIVHDVDSAITSFLLVIMVEFTAHSWLSFGWEPDKESFDFEQVLKEASSLWNRAVYK